MKMFAKLFGAQKKIEKDESKRILDECSPAHITKK